MTVKGSDLSDNNFDQNLVKRQIELFRYNFNKIFLNDQYLPVNNKQNDLQKKFKLFGLHCAKASKFVCYQIYNIFMKLCCGPILLYYANNIFDQEMIKGCENEKSIEKCIENIIMKNVDEMIYQIQQISVLTYIFLYLCWKKWIPRISLVPFVIGMYYKCFIQYDISLSSQKLEYFVGFLIYIIVLLNIVLAIVHKIVRVYYNLYLTKKKKFILVFGATLVAALCFQQYLIGTCNDWDNGIAGYIINDQQQCNVLQPYICWANVVDNWFLFNFSCKIDDLKGAKLELLTLYNKIIPETHSQAYIDMTMAKFNYMAYPMTSRFSSIQKNLEIQTQNSIIQTAIFTDQLSQARASGREAIVDLNQMKLDFYINKNKNLLIQRKGVYNSKQHLAKNVILIYIDTLSRAQAHRKLPKTMDFLYQFTDYNKEKRTFTKQGNSQAKLYEYFRFHAIDKKTRNNSFKLQYDVTRNQYKTFRQYRGRRPNLIQEFKDRGYITGHSTNTCTSTCSFRYDFRRYKRYFNEASADHEFLMYDPQYMDPDNYYNFQQGINSIFRRCIYNTDTSEHVFNYGVKFLETYIDEPKFLFMEFTDSHEVTSEKVAFMDDHIYNFFVQIQEMGYFSKDTNIMLLSDHGQHILTTVMPQYENNEIIPTNSFHQIERMLPLYMNIVTKDILEQNPGIDKNMFDNQQKLIGMQQVRNTIISSAEDIKNSNYYSDSIYAPREQIYFCQDLGFAGIDPIQWCMCKNPDFEDALRFLEEYTAKKEREAEKKELEKKRKQEQKEKIKEQEERKIQFEEYKIQQQDEIEINKQQQKKLRQQEEMAKAQHDQYQQMMNNIKGQKQDDQKQQNIQFDDDEVLGEKEFKQNRGKRNLYGKKYKK